jgi:hypothetical protein
VNENRPPGSTIPESHPVRSDVDVWEIESLFVHVTVVPTSTFSSSGVKARFPSVAAPTGIVTDDDDPPGAGVGDGVGDGPVEGDEELPPPQAAAKIRIPKTAAIRNENMGASEHERVEHACGRWFRCRLRRRRPHLHLISRRRRIFQDEQKMRKRMGWDKTCV